MEALILAAGVGDRLRPAWPDPKCLLRFGGRTLLERQLAALRRVGVEGVTLVVGHRAERVIEAIGAIPDKPPARCVVNPAFTRGSVLSALAGRAVLDRGGPVLLMDADVLFDEAILERLVASDHGVALLLDRGFEPGDEPVKVAVQGGRIVGFGKRLEPGLGWDVIGESVGFFKLDGPAARAFAGGCDAIVSGGGEDRAYEDALAGVLLDRGSRAGAVDVTGLAWTEVDFPEDIRAGESRVLPRLGGAGVRAGAGRGAWS